MSLPRSRSLLWPSVAIAAAVLLLLGLGTWQVQRLFWKEDLIARRNAAVTATPIDPPRSRSEAATLEYHPVRATGHFLNDRELYLGATSDDGHPGYQVITPLVMADGETLLVERGFVPENRRAPETRAAGQPDGDVTVIGLMRVAPDAKPHWFLPDNNAQRNYWFYVDIPAMTAAQHLDHVLPYYIDADKTPNPGGLPVGGQTRLELPNDHLQYAITWYALALVVIVMYGVFLRRRTERESA